MTRGLLSFHRLNQLLEFEHFVFQVLDLQLIVFDRLVLWYFMRVFVGLHALSVLPRHLQEVLLLEGLPQVVLNGAGFHAIEQGLLVHSLRSVQICTLVYW